MTAALPAFGQWMTNTVASPDNPQRNGMFVRVVRVPHGRMNAGTWCELTDGQGTFWQVKPENLVPSCIVCAGTREVDGLPCQVCVGSGVAA